MLDELLIFRTEKAEWKRAWIETLQQHDNSNYLAHFQAPHAIFVVFHDALTMCVRVWKFNAATFCVLRHTVSGTRDGEKEKNGTIGRETTMKNRRSVQLNGINYSQPTNWRLKRKYNIIFWLYCFSIRNKISFYFIFSTKNSHYFVKMFHI